MSYNKRKLRKLRLGAKKKSSVAYLELFWLQEGIRVFCFDGSLHLLPQQELMQLICLIIYISTTQQTPARVSFCKIAPTRTRHT